jgi:hypothetical protein
MQDGRYKQYQHWNAEGWDWVRNNNISAPLYWHFLNDNLHNYEPSGLQLADAVAQLSHISCYEAAAFAAMESHRVTNGV